MDKAKVFSLIDIKVKEHEQEIKACADDMLKVKSIKPKNAEEAGKILVVKDKFIFHKSCILALLDLKTELEKLNV